MHCNSTNLSYLLWKSQVNETQQSAYFLKLVRELHWLLDIVCREPFYPRKLLLEVSLN